MVLVDTNRSNIERCKELDLEAINASIYTDDLTDNIELNDVGYLIAITGNDEINRQALNKYQKTLGENGAFRLMNADEHKRERNTLLNNHELLSTRHDYARLIQVANEFPSIQEIPVKSKQNFMKLIAFIEDEDDVVALFLKDQKQQLTFINNPSEMDAGAGCQLVYLGRPIDFEDVLRSKNRGQNNQDKDM